MPDAVLTFGAFQLSPGRRTLVRDGKAVRLGGRALDILIVMVERAGELVTKQLLVERVWPSTFVDDTNLRVHVAALRKILGDGGAGERFIATVAGRGYCFVAAVSAMCARQSLVNEPAAPQAVHNLPVPLTRTIGRDAVVEMIVARLPQRRFVTIVGPGGIGKTTVAVAVAGSLVGSYRDRVCFVDLGPIADHRLVPTTLASALGTAPQPDDPLPMLLAYLRNKSMLIVLDNCEHVLESVAALAEGILRGAPGVHLLATSREAFRAEGESLFRLSTLGLPPRYGSLQVTAALGFSSVELFVERAGAASDSFTLTEANVPTVCEICRRLDGIPLAIELAAALVGTIGVKEVATRLTDCFSALSAGRRTALPRHRTLRATIDWSHSLLSPSEQLVFRRLAPMVGAFTIEAAVAVVTPDAVPGASVLELLASLVDKSLVATDGGSDVIRYRLFETTRAYAAERLAQSADAEPVAHRYAAYFRELMQRGEAEWNGQASPGWLATYADSLDDVRAAIDWALSPSGDLSMGIDLIAASAPLWFQLSLLSEHGQRAQRATQCLTPTIDPDGAQELRLLLARGNAHWYSANDIGAMERLFTRALAIAERIGDRPALLQALWGTWAGRRGHGDFTTALAIATRYHTIARDAGDEAATLLGDRILGLTHHLLGNQAEARDHVERALAAVRMAPASSGTGLQVDTETAMAALLARIHWLLGFPDRARAIAREALDAAWRADHWYSVCYALYLAACPVSLWAGDLEEADRRVQLFTSRPLSNAIMDEVAALFGLALRLRQGDARNALTAQYIESQLELSKLRDLSDRFLGPAIEVPEPDPEPKQELWNTAELLRVDAELLLWHRSPGHAEAAEAKLLRALGIARRQRALSWELRTSLSLARLWHARGRTEEARGLLAAICARFTEGFDTVDFVAAQSLLAGWGG
jgi:predicted ATPase/DNA-binding winged helix-turn-helix (wHTH) protein